MDMYKVYRLLLIMPLAILLLLCGCAAQPIQVTCVYPTPPAELMVPPPQETMRSKLDRILGGSFTKPPTPSTGK